MLAIHFINRPITDYFLSVPNKCVTGRLLVRSPTEYNVLRLSLFQLGSVCLHTIFVQVMQEATDQFWRSKLGKLGNNF